MKLILFLSSSSLSKKIIIIILDIIIFNFSFWISYNLRDVSFFLPNYNQYIHLIIGNCIYFFFYIYFKIYNIFLRFFEIGIIKVFIKFFFFFSITFFLISLIINLNTIQKFSPFIIALVSYSLVIVSRYLIFNLIHYKSNNKKNIAIIGSSELQLNYLNSNKAFSPFNIKFFFTNNSDFINRNISSIIIKDISYIFEVIKKANINHIVILPNTIQSNQIRKITNKFKKLKIPTIYYNNEIFISQNNNNHESFNRGYVNRGINFFYKKKLNMIKNNIIFISGAGGSIGSELSKQILLFQPKKIILFDISEYNLFKINQEIETLKKNSTEVISILGDICNFEMINNIFIKYQPNIVFHAAAIKHVKIAEENIFSCIYTNIIGTKNILDAVRQCKKTKKFILISTDKAVKPVNIMGISKRFAELLMKLEQKNLKDSKSYIAVRFGNVANSSGSVFTIWKEQLMNAQKLTITDPNATRYLMSISEAVNLVLDASILAKMGEIFVLDMGKPHKIIDLLKFFLQSYSLKIKSTTNPEGIDYKIIGLKKGEKKHENLFYNKNYSRTINKYIFNTNEGLLRNKTEIVNILNRIKKSSKASINNTLIKNIINFVKKNDL